MCVDLGSGEGESFVLFGFGKEEVGREGGGEGG
jgi:hypothetical protein